MSDLFHYFVHSISSWAFIALGVLGLFATEVVPGENSLIRAGIAAGAITMLIAAFVKVWVILGVIKDSADDFGDLRHRVPELEAKLNHHLESDFPQLIERIQVLATSIQRLEAAAARRRSGDLP